MSSSRGNYQPQACNLCWKELQAPFLVTSCNHVFCLSHRDHESFKQQSCPGCSHHLSESKGLKQANNDVKSSDLPVLNGVTPDAALKVAGTAIKFWVLQERTAAAIAQRLARCTTRYTEQPRSLPLPCDSHIAQERTQLNFMQHQAQRAQASKDEQRERFEEVYNQAKEGEAAAIAEKEQALQQNEELARENDTLHQKLQTQSNTVRALEQTVVKLKRGVPDSPTRGTSPLPRPMEQPPPQRSPLRSGQNQMFSPLRNESSLLAQPSPFPSQRSRLGVGAPLHQSPSLHQHQRLSSPAPSLNSGGLGLGQQRTDLRGRRPSSGLSGLLGRTTF